jgi:putative hydrolase of HD superfamily
MMNQSISSFEPLIKTRTDYLMALSDVVGKFMDVERATYRNGVHETDGQHTLHLQFMAVAYAAKYHPELDIGKVCLYALIHDFIEVYAGDTNSLTAPAKVMVQKSLTEQAAVTRLKAELGDIWPDFIELIISYERLEVPEARYVKSFDKCDPHISHYQDKGLALIQMGIVNRIEFEELCQQVGERLARYAGEFPDVVAIRQELLGRVIDVVYPTV